MAPVKGMDVTIPTDAPPYTKLDTRERSNNGVHLLMMLRMQG
jgi:hypothetical protein